MENTYKISSIIDSYISGDWGNDCTTDDTPYPVYCVRGADIVPISNSQFNDIPLRYVSKRSFQTRCLQEGDIIIEKSGGSPTQSTGRVVYVSKELLSAKKNIVCSNFCTAFRVKEGWNAHYVFLYLQNVYNSGVFFNFEGKTSGLKNLMMDAAFKSIPIKKIPIAKQTDLADSISAIDKKLSLNRQINDNLEAMAKQLYDYWFVQFDFPNEEGKPYKSSGGAMDYNEKLKREIPQGWHCYELNKWLEIKSGFAFKSETYISKGKFKVVTIKNVQDHHLDTSSCDYVNEIPHGMKEWCSLSVNDRLISLTGNCGRLCIVTEKDLLLNQRVGLLACNDEYIDYAYLLLSSEEYQTLSNNLAKGAAQANLSPVDLCKNVAVLPKLDVLEKFNRQIKPIVASYIQNDIQIADLTKQRDELLPLLMNGQASVNSD